jgi:hypothetical protein
MSNTFFPGAFVRRRIFVSYHHHGDRYYYEDFSRRYAAMYDAIQDNSVEREIDSDDSEYVMRRIREEYITGSSCTVVLCGHDTPWRKFVDWEIKATLDKQHALIGVVLPTSRVTHDGTHLVPDRLADNVQSNYAVWTFWASLVNEPRLLTTCLEAANARSASFIRNERALRRRNG